MGKSSKSIIKSKPFTLDSGINPLSVRSGWVELRGHRIALPGIISCEALQRGCDYRAWFEKLVSMGIRHLMVPLNSFDEDTCIFARRHPKWAMDSVEPSPPERVVADVSVAAETPASAVFDLEHRDEGFFARLKFLLEAADAAGVLVGLTLFDLAHGQSGGPFRREANLQGLSFEELLKNPQTTNWQDIERIFDNACEWIATDIRPRRGVWMSAFRGQIPFALEPYAHPLAERLTQRLDALLTRTVEDPLRSRHGSWVASSSSPNGPIAIDTEAKHPRAPFDLRCGAAPELDATAALERYLSAENKQVSETPSESVDILNFGKSQQMQRPTLYAIEESILSADNLFSSGKFSRGKKNRVGHELAWRCLMRGQIPLISAGVLNTSGQLRCHWLSQLAIFFKQWVGKNYLRACPEILTSMPSAAIRRGPLHAATDGNGRFFIYFESGWLKQACEHRRRKNKISTHSGPPPFPGIVLSILPGAYRFFWFDPQKGKGLDVGDGITGGTHCIVPGIVTDRDALLILEQEDLPDPLSVW